MELISYSLRALHNVAYDIQCPFKAVNIMYTPQWWMGMILWAPYLQSFRFHWKGSIWKDNGFPVIKPLLLYEHSGLGHIILRIQPKGAPPGGGTQIWVGQGCAAQALKPLPIFKGDFDRKGYPFLRIFLEKLTHFSKISRFSGFSPCENPKIWAQSEKLTQDV